MTELSKLLYIATQQGAEFHSHYLLDVSRK